MKAGELQKGDLFKLAIANEPGATQMDKLIWNCRGRWADKKIYAWCVSHTNFRATFLRSEEVIKVGSVGVDKDAEKTG